MQKIFFLSDEVNGWIVGEKTILRTTNSGESWTKVDSSSNWNAVFFADSLNGWVVGDSATIAKTSDGGRSWVQTDISFALDGDYRSVLINSIGTIYVAGDGGYAFSRDGGKRWGSEHFSMEWGFKIHAMSVATDGTLFLGGTNRIVSILNGNLEIELEDETTILDFDFLEYPNGWAGTTNGLLRRQMISTGVDFGGATPNKFELHQNYPNPFNPSTTIQFDLSEAGYVSLNVYNNAGQLVRTLVSGDYPQGSHKIVWDARDNSDARVASGLYLYTIKVGQHFTAQRKLIVLK